MSASIDENTATNPAKGTGIAIGLHAMNLLGVSLMAALTLLMFWGFNKVNGDIARFDAKASQKLDAIEQIDRSIGYGGMIHHLKNYVIRRDAKYADAFNIASNTAQQAIDDYRTFLVDEDIERRQLDKVERLIADYRAALSRIHGSDLPAEQVDARARVDDTEYIAALQSLRRLVRDDREKKTAQLRADTAEVKRIVILVCVVTTLLLLGANTPLILRLDRRVVEQIQRSDTLRIEAENANTVKTEFLANMSHEIRTPMTAIIGYADILSRSSDQQDTEFADSAILAIQSNANHLLNILNDILDVSKLETGKLAIDRRAVSPGDILRQTAGLFRSKATQNNLDFTIETTAALPTRVFADATRIRQLVLNLVGNAIKFTEKGSISVVMDYNPETSMLSVSVRDTGIGMTRAQLEQIRRHEAFVQADTTTTRRFGGSGLGLRICHALCQLMQGELRIDSEEGLGTTCTAVIFAEATESPSESRNESTRDENSEKAASTTDKPLEGRDILLVEDGIENQRLISFILKKAGARVTIRNNGQEGVDAFASENASSDFDLCVMDMQMPIKDGYTATREIREMGLRLPILALTADAMPGTRERCLEAGCSEYMTKPIRREQLVERCRTWLDSGDIPHAA